MKHLNFETVGNPENPPLLLIHGFMSSNLQWALNQEALGESYFLVMIETWGHGDSPEADSLDDYSPERFASELKAICDQLSIKKTGLVGHSFGSAVLIHFALHYPDHVNGLVFTNSKAVIAERLLSPKKLSPLISLLDQGIPTDPEERKKLSRKLPMHPIHAKRLAEHLKQPFIEAADKVPLESLQAFVGNRTSMACRDRLTELNIPTLMINGVYEKELQDDVQDIKRDFSNIEVLDVEAGHSPNLDLAEEFNRITLEFFARISS